MVEQVAKYDQLFTIRNNEKAGLLSLQSPDKTDIFLQFYLMATIKRLLATSGL